MEEVKRAPKTQVLLENEQNVNKELLCRMDEYYIQHDDNDPTKLHEL